MTRILLVLSLLVALVGCGAGARVCPTQATRCDGPRVELCDSSGRWYEVVNCDEVARTSGGEWECSTSFEDGEERNACLPTEAP